MRNDPTVNVVVFRLRSANEPMSVDTDARAEDAVRKAWWKVFLQHRPRTADVVAVHSDWEPSADDASFMQRTFTAASVTHEFDRPGPDGWDAAFERASRAADERPDEPFHPIPDARPTAPDERFPTPGDRIAALGGRFPAPNDRTELDERFPIPGERIHAIPDLRPPQDADWPFLTVDQARRIREQTRAALARRGVATTMQGPDLLVLQSESVFPLDNLARSCHQAPEDQWDEIIESHAAVASTFDTSDDKPSEVIPPGRVYLRLLDAESVPWELRYARPVTDGLIEALAVDQPDKVQILSDNHLMHADINAVRRTARANLIAEPVSYERISDPDGGDLHHVYGESMFVASKALVLPELMADVAGIRPPDDGVLIAVPTRHQLVFHPILDETVFPSLEELNQYALSVFEKRPGPLSPLVYWWHAGDITPLANVVDEENDEIQVIIPPGLGAVLNRISG